MAKTKTAFFCQNCGAQSAKWVGKCPTCGEWNTYAEEVIKSEKGKSDTFSVASGTPHLITDISAGNTLRMPLPDKELTRVLGGGLVQGSLVLFGGEPGIGKSTLLLQVALAAGNLKVLYVSGEESQDQIKMRAERTGIKNPNCYILTETLMQNIFQQAELLKPHLLIVDSIQTLYTSLIDSAPGSISQVRQCTADLMRYSKSTNVPVFIIGHITKDGSIAGPKVLEHMVDTVLQFEGDTHHIYRLLRTTKNRFGSTNELGIYEMTSGGLREVSNPSEVLITAREEPVSGVAIAAITEGVRPLLIEAQALVSTAAYGTPQRSSTGFDLRRLSMLLAVLEKRCGFRLAAKDVFINIAGGIKVADPAADLALVAAILSSGEEIPLPNRVCFAGEIGLSGEIRPVNRIDQRVAEAEKMGFEQIFISRYNNKELPKRLNIKVQAVGKTEEFFTKLFG
ncbi:MAG: DNA repair protein RadA [Bacteroidia bacterium]|jgi:DNA repair protein RadA/Sms|nr:DNA repair protein RadA [Bacteroidia bacterium]